MKVVPLLPLNVEVLSQLLYPNNDSSSSSRAKERRKRNKTLGTLLRHFVGMKLGIELKTGRIYYGTLSSIDPDMSVLLLDASSSSSKNRSSCQKEPSSSITYDDSVIHSTVTSQPQQSRSSTNTKWLHIRGSKIRYIHFLSNGSSSSDKTQSLSGIIQQGLDRERNAMQKYKRGIRKSAVSK